MADESHWIERAQAAEARLATCQDNQNRIKTKLRDMMGNLGAKERGDGTIDIDFVALVERLDPVHALELRAAIDQHHKISGAAGEKPRIRLAG